MDNAIRIVDGEGNVLLRIDKQGVAIIPGHMLVDGDISGHLSVSGTNLHAEEGVWAGQTINLAAPSGDLGDRPMFGGIPNIKMVALGTGADGTDSVVRYIADDDPHLAWTEDNCTAETDADHWRQPGNCLKVSFPDNAAAGEGITNDIAQVDMEGDKAIGFWIYPEVDLEDGDLVLQVVDDTSGAVDFDVPASWAHMWNWVEVDITSLAGGAGNEIEEVKILLSSDGADALANYAIWLDAMFKWAEAAEEDLDDEFYLDGIIAVWAHVTGHGEANTPLLLEEWTNYFALVDGGVITHIVWITDQSTTSGMLLGASSV